jgi:transcriptional regulator with XRE-family HTH domain
MLSHLVNGGKIREVRERRGHSVAELAEAAHITVGHLYKVETDKKQPSLKVLRQIADALEAEVEDFLGSTKPRRPRNRAAGGTSAEKSA